MQNAYRRRLLCMHMRITTKWTCGREIYLRLVKRFPCPASVFATLPRTNAHVVTRVAYTCGLWDAYITAGRGCRHTQIVRVYDCIFPVLFLCTYGRGVHSRDGRNIVVLFLLLFSFFFIGKNASASTAKRSKRHDYKTKPAIPLED